MEFDTILLILLYVGGLCAVYTYGIYLYAILSYLLPTRIKNKIDKLILAAKIGKLIGTKIITVKRDKLKLKVGKFLDYYLKRGLTLKAHSNSERTFTLTYPLGNKSYRMIITPSVGLIQPSPILFAYNEKDEDITERLISYLGPLGNWHGMKYTPWLLEENAVTIHLSNGEERTFNSFDPIKVD